MPAQDVKERIQQFPSEWWRQLSPWSWDLPFTVTTCALSVVSGTVKYETEPQYGKNSQAFLEAVTEVGYGGGKETVRRM